MEWISIKDKLPDNTDEVLISIRGTMVPVQAYYVKSRNKWYGSMEVRDCMNEGHVNDPELSGQSCITHWQPLPEIVKYD